MRAALRFELKCVQMLGRARRARHQRRFVKTKDGRACTGDGPRSAARTLRENAPQRESGFYRFYEPSYDFPLCLTSFF